MNNAEWEHAFAGYRQTGQYQVLNSDFTLSDFKFIFFWEWFHRLWARALGVVFAIGFIYFLSKKYFDRQMVRPFIILFILGGLQGLIGWIMVKTGLNTTDLHVSHIALSIHFISAMILACFTLWFALQLLIPAEQRVVDKGLYNFTVIIVLLLFVQLTYGAFMAGLKAAMSAPTWPTINTMWIPDGLMQRSFISDKINVHFMHRGFAYILFTLLIFWFGMSGRKARVHYSALLRKTRWWPFVLVLLQIVLGIITVLSAPLIHPGKFGGFEWLAELHQLVAMFLLMALVVNMYVVKAGKTA